MHADREKERGNQNIGIVIQIIVQSHFFMQKELIIVVSLILFIDENLLNDPGPVVHCIISYMSKSVKPRIHLQEEHEKRNS